MISEKIMNANYKSIVIPCKPYVGRFMIQNFGDPVNLYSVNNAYLLMFKRCLEKPWKRRESKLSTQPRLTCTVEIMISDCDFYRFGWELSLTDMAYLHTAFEKAVKLFMRTCVAIDISMSGSQAQSIRRFQTQYEYPDEIWPFQSIKKDLDRNLPMDIIKFEKDVYVKFQKIVLAILYKSGTITKNNTLTHEKPYKRQKQHRRSREIVAPPIQVDLFSST
ncbi:MAG: hypothetical protein NTV01_10790 [Bacteroidia bacterium]|nr:hypothetical protein [Bacteroidia bacterium]